MEQAITLDDIRRAWHARDPALAQFMVALVNQSIPQGAVRRDALTWRNVVHGQRDYAFRRLDLEQRRQKRLADWRALESDDAEEPLPDRFWLHRLLFELWEDDSPWARRQLVQAVHTLPLKWGPWRAVKAIFKQAEAKGDWEMFGAITARLDTEYAAGRSQGDVSRGTLRYLVRRAWRRLRRVGLELPSSYPDIAAEVLRHYTGRVRFPQQLGGQPHLLSRP